MPLHPLLVHFPIALLIIGAVVEIVNVFLKKETLNKMGTTLIVIGFISGIATVLSGDGAEEFAFSNWGRILHDQVELHSFFADLSMIIFGVLTAIKLLFKHTFFKFEFLKKPIFKSGLITILIIILSISGTALMAITGHLGGKIVYEHQVSTNQ
ncbi:DUF2231 domain-containing protein [Bacillus massiliigorillae]|uniref:DUF2231 domain-containing protein n=1 Tax=Bacillus massiliigorillae TaxID=1243664 RepID=UPI0003AAD220|nr:DUF2231 domain-containing protein [Bacillus massiliigorillae]